jgi:hypothetical protein
MNHNSLKLLLMSSPVGSLGSGLTGGVELTLRNIASDLVRRGHQVKMVLIYHAIIFVQDQNRGSDGWGELLQKRG